MPPQETNFSFSKKVLIWLSGAASGVVIIILAAFFLYKSNLLTGLFIDLTSSFPEQTVTPGQVNVQATDVSALPKRIVETNNQRIVVLVPKTMASQEYRDSLNDTVNDFNEMALTANNELVPALSEMGENYKIKNFAAFFDNLSAIKAASAKGYELVSRISEDLERLKAANQTTMDLGAKSLTVPFLEKGEAMVESAKTVLNIIDKMLSVGIFNPGVFAEMAEADAAFNKKVDEFNAATKELLEHIAKRVEETVSSGR